jgi:hypothetical protein
MGDEMGIAPELTEWLTASAMYAYPACAPPVNR